MKKWLSILILVLVVLGLGGWWFWSLAAVPAEAAANVTLRVEHAPVSVRAPGASTFEEAQTGAVLVEGTTVKTGEGGEAVLVIFHQAESRIDQNSEVTVQAASMDPTDPTKMSIGLDVGIGRIWSRVLRLFDLDSKFTVKTSNVVATVRGTSFDVRANADKTSEVWVSESAVTVKPANEDLGDMFDLRTTTTRTGTSYDDFGQTSGFLQATGDAALAEGFSAVFGANGKTKEVKRISSETRAGAWFSNNHTADTSFVRGERDRRREELKRLGGTTPDHFLNGFTRMSERLHLALAAKDKSDKLAEQYLARRLARLIELAENGKAGLASQEFARLENDVRTRLQGTQGADERRRIKIALARVELLVDDAEPTSALYPFKQRLEDLALVLQQDDQAATLFIRLLAVDARLDEASHLLDDNQLEEARTALDAAKSGIENVARDANVFLLQLTADRREALYGKLLALRSRESAQRARFRSALQDPAPIVIPTSTAPVAPTSTQPTTPVTPPKPPTTPPVVTPPPTTPPPVTPPPTTPPPPTTGTPEYTSISLYMQPNPINIGQTGSLIVLAKKADGSTVDVTAKSTFALTSGAATLNGPRITGTTANSVTVQATYNDKGTTRTANLSFIVAGSAVFQSLTVTASKTQLASGDTASFTASAMYSSGYSENVTSKVTWTKLDALGTLNGSTYTAPAQGSGNVTIQGSYTVDGVTKTDSAMVTVTETRGQTYNPNGYPTNY